MTATSDLMSWWLWPLNAAKLGSDLIDTMTGARDVVAARSTQHDDRDRLARPVQRRSA